MTKRWTIERDGHIADYGKPSREALIEYINDKYADECADNEELCYGDVVTEKAFLIEYFLDNDCEMVVTKREPYFLEYEHYHGDYEEHRSY